MRRRFYFFIAVLFQFLFHGLASSQTPWFEEVPFQYQNTEIKIQKMLVADAGWLFFGTDHGLFRYDGIAFRKIISKDSLKDEIVTALFESTDKKIWIGFKDGSIATYKDKNLRLFKTEEGLPKVAITCFTESSDSILWVGTNGEGIYCIYKKRVYNFNTDDGLNDNFIHALHKNGDSNGILSASDQGINICSLHGGKKFVSRLQ